MDYEKAYNKLKAFCETLYDGVYCNNCGLNNKESGECEDCHRKAMMWEFPKETIKAIEDGLEEKDGTNN